MVTPLSVLSLLPFSVKLARTAFCTRSENVIFTELTAVLVGDAWGVQTPVGPAVFMTQERLGVPDNGVPLKSLIVLPATTATVYVLGTASHAARPLMTYTDPAV